jgi:hypothetical protein
VGFRWAPRTLLTLADFYTKVTLRNHVEEQGKLTPDGLEIYFPGFILSNMGPGLAGRPFIIYNAVDADFFYARRSAYQLGVNDEDVV